MLLYIHTKGGSDGDCRQTWTNGVSGAWIAVTIVAFLVFWPAGLAVLAYMIWSGRMGCRHYYWDESMKDEFRQRREAMRDEWRARREEWHDMKRAWHDEMRSRWQAHQRAAETSGNAAFDDYKAETLRRLEEEQAEFSDFLTNLRKARDKAEFDQFMRNRKVAPETKAPSREPTHRHPNPGRARSRSRLAGPVGTLFGLTPRPSGPGHPGPMQTPPVPPGGVFVALIACSRLG